MTDLVLKGLGSTLASSEWNILFNKLTSGIDSINTGSVVAQSIVISGPIQANTGSFVGSLVANSILFNNGSFVGSVIANSLQFNNGSVIGSLIAPVVQTSTGSVGGSIVANSIVFQNGSVIGSLVLSGMNLTGNANMANAYVTGSYVISGTTNKLMSPAGTGSPTTWGRFIQAGSATVGTGSQVWVVFGTGFTIIPTVALGKYALADDFWLIAGSLNAGSMFVQGKTASTFVNWIGVG